MIFERIEKPESFNKINFQEVESINGINKDCFLRERLNILELKKNHKNLDCFYRMEHQKLLLKPEWVLRIASKDLTFEEIKHLLFIAYSYMFKGKKEEGEVLIKLLDNLNMYRQEMFVGEYITIKTDMENSFYATKKLYSI